MLDACKTFHDWISAESPFLLCTIVGLVRLRRGHKLSTTSTSTQQKTTSCCWPCGPSKLLCCTSKKAGNSKRKASSNSRPSDETYFYHISESPEWIKLLTPQSIHLAETLLDNNHEAMWDVVLPIYGALRKSIYFFQFWDWILKFVSRFW